MSTTEPVVHKEPPVQSNPFARALAGHVNAGAVAIESERAIAEAQGKLVIAKRFPRDQAKAYANIMDACKRPGLAEEACYSFPRGGKAVSGPSIRLTEMLAANWGNVDYGLRELSRKEGVSEMEAYCWDLETNTMSSQKFTVRHIRDKTGGNVTLTDERDIYELTANMGARRLRARILAIIPADLAQAAVDECTRTLAGSNEIPLVDRVRNMVSAFNNQGVTAALIEKRLGHPIATILPDELADLRKIHVSIRDGISKPGDWFGDGATNPDLESAEPAAPARAEPKARATRGAAAAKAAQETPPTTEEPKAAPAAVTPPAEPAKPAEDIQKQMEARQAKTEAAKVEPAKTEVKADAPTPRAFLQDGEKLTVIAKVETMEAVAGNVNGKRFPAIKALLSGGFNGDVRHKEGGARFIYAGDKETGIEALPPWKVGAVLSFNLIGQKSTSASLNGKVLVFVESVSAVGESASAVDQGEAME